MRLAKHINLLTLCGVLIIAVYIMFGYLFKAYDILFLGMAVALLALDSRLRIHVDTADALWLTYILIMFVFGLFRDDSAITIKRFLLLNTLLVIKIVLQSKRLLWSRPFEKALLAFGFVHVASILVEVANPALIRTYRRLLQNVFHTEMYLDHTSAIYRFGITNQPAVAGFCIAIFSCITVVRFMDAESEDRRENILMLFTSMVALFLTGKRGLLFDVFLSTFSVFFIYYVVIQRRAMRLFVVAVLFIVILLSIMRLPQFSTNYERLLYGDDAGRFAIWDVLVNNFMSSPIIGVGRDVYMEQMDIGAHNEYLRVLSENGLLGCVFFVSALLAPLVKMCKTIVNNRKYIYCTFRTDQRYVVHELILSLAWQIAILLYAFTGNPLNTTVQSASYFVFLAMGTHALRELERTRGLGKAVVTG